MQLRNHLKAQDQHQEQEEPKHASLTGYSNLEAAGERGCQISMLVDMLPQLVHKVCLLQGSSDAFSGISTNAQLNI